MTTESSPVTHRIAPSSDVGRRALAWWTAHCGPEAGDASTRARLRRARSGLDVLAVPAGVMLARQLGASRSPDRAAKALDLAHVLAHVRRDSDRAPMQAAGWQRFPFDATTELPPDQRPRLSEARFRHLIRAEHADGELATAFIRLIALLDGEASVASLATAFWHWDAQDQRIRRRWAFEYYAAGAAAPDDDSADTLPHTHDEDVAG